MPKPKGALAVKAFASVLSPPKQSAEIFGQNVAILRCKGNFSWQPELNLRSEGGSAHHFKPSSHPLRSFRHSQQAATTAAPVAYPVGIHTAPIVTNQHSKIVSGKVEFSLHLARLGVPEGVQ
jgi:hypothetical protein